MKIRFSSSPDHGLCTANLDSRKSSCCDTGLCSTAHYDPRQAGGVRLPHLVQSIDIAPTLLHRGTNSPRYHARRESSSPYPETKRSMAQSRLRKSLAPTRKSTLKLHDRSVPLSVTSKWPSRKNPRINDHHNVYANSLTASIHEPIVYEELYHTAIDPYEAINLIHNKNYFDIAEELRNECEKLVRIARGPLHQPPETILLNTIKQK